LIDFKKKEINKLKIVNLVNDELFLNIDMEIKSKISIFCETLEVKYKDINILELLDYDFDNLLKEKFKNKIYLK
jgi:hypothetical protein